ncbi:rhodanese family protein [Roseomonas sp. HJA6]|uniref:Rhodanese family protein n=1 Tax=Roseomonas alba TaxID=2846776 RepID=A0ABS7A2T3_9PROT|nr:rhodanese family protein [Neoroseomonas alba]MBW6396627.1 rhodanese family protein [Neoroseomonas alba]
MLKTVTPEHAARLIRDEGALLVDVREADEFARERIPGAQNLPLSRLDPAELAQHEGGKLLFHCRSGARTTGHVARLAACAGPIEAYVVAGGLDAWKRAGLPTAENRRQPLELMRQVQITAGSMIALGVVLGATVSPLFYAVSGFMGAGLVFAGLTGLCPLARLLRAMPWNRAASLNAAA